MAKKRLSRLIGQVVIRANMADSRRKPFSALGFSYTMNISYNVTYSLMTIESFCLRKTKPKRFAIQDILLHKACYVNFRFLRKTWSDRTKDFSRK